MRTSLTVTTPAGRYYAVTHSQSASLNDVFYNAVALLLRSSPTAVNASNNNTIADSSANGFTVTRTGNVAQGKFSPYGSVGGSLFFDGTGDYITLPTNSNLNFGTGDFTIELWFMRTTANGTLNMLFDTRATAGVSNNNSLICIDAAGKPLWLTNGVTAITGTTTIAQGTWYHYAITRSGSVDRMFINGVQEGASYADSQTYAQPGANRPIIGADAGAAQGFFGHMTDIRVVKGTALYTSSFAVPTAPLTAITNTQLLISASSMSTNSNVIDVTARNDIETSGTVAASTAVKVFSGASMSFDGTAASKIEIKANPSQWSMGTSDFTIEAWIYPTSVALSNYLSSNTSYMGWEIQSNGTNWVFNSSSNASTWDIASSIVIGSVEPNKWQHLAISRSGGKIYLFKNGVLNNTVTSALALTACVQGIGVWCRVGTNANANPGYMDDFRVTKGVGRYTADFAIDLQTPSDPYTNQAASLVVATDADPFAATTIVQMAMNGANSSTAFSDVKGNTFTATSATISTAQSKFDGASGYFTGTGSHVVGPSPEIVNGDYTVEAWVYLTNAAAGTVICQGAGNNGFGLGLMVNNSGAGFLALNRSNASWVPFGSTLSINTWYHIAVCVSGNVMYGFLDGTLLSTATDNTTYAAGGALCIGAFSATAANTFRFKGYIDNLRITKAARWTNSFTVPTSSFPDGTNNQIVDSSSNNFPIARVGDVAQGTFSPFSNTGFSAYFNGTSSTVTASNAALALGTGDFTMECWAFLNDVTTNRTIYSHGDYSLATGFEWYSGSGQLAVYAAGAVLTTANSGIKANTWFHCALVRSSGTLKCFVNGVQCASAAFANNLTQSQSIIGGVSTAFTQGYISNYRIVKGTAVYSSTFTPPTGNLTAITNTVLLCLQDNRFVDRSTSNLALTLAGAPVIQAFSPFTPTTYSAATNGGSMYFDGTGDYLTVPDSESFTIPGDFTVEMWIYKTAATVNTVFGNWVGGNSTFSCHIMSNGYLSFSYSPAASGDVQITGTTVAVRTNEWTHVAWCRSGSTIRMFVNGVADSVTASLSGAFRNATSPWYIGAFDSTVNYLTGYLSNVRLLNGTALYTSAFTPPTAPLTAIANTKLLLNGTNSAVYDNSGKVNLEMLGTCKVSTAVKKYSSSIQFDGSAGCYGLLTGSNTLFNFGTGDFTIECWAYNDAGAGTTRDLWDMRNGNTGRIGPLFINSSNVVQLHSDGAYIVTGTTVITQNAWHHYAVSRVGSSLRVFVDGVQEGATATNSTNFTASGYPTIGTNCQTPLSAEYWRGYIEDLRITKGVGRYTTGFTPPVTTLGTVTKALPAAFSSQSSATVEATGGDPYYNNVVLHMHMDGLNGGTTFADQKGHVATPTLVTTSVQNKKFGLTSASYTAATSAISFPISTDYALSTKDYTIEFWCNPNNTANYQFLLDFGTSIQLFRHSTNVFGFWRTGMVGSGVFGTTATVAGTWYHIALVRTNGVTKLYVNGVSEVSAADTVDHGAGTAIYVGKYSGDNTHNWLGYMDEVRVTKGFARYTENFAVPTAAFPDYQDFTSDQYLKQSILLKSATSALKPKATLADISGNTSITVVNGIPLYSGLSPYAGAGNSIEFDGSSVGLKIPGFTLTGDFTVECWFRPTVACGRVFDIYNAAGNTGLGFHYYNGSCYYDHGYNASTGITNPALNTWTHLAMSRTGSTQKTYINGVQFATETNAQTYGDATTFWYIGGDAGADANQVITGNIADFRVVNGTGLYPAAFTPPAAPLTSVANTKILLTPSSTANIKSYQNSTFIDSAKDLPITRTGNVAQGTFSPFSNAGWSVNFNGSSYFKAPIPSTFVNSSFTIECWVMQSAIAGANPRIFETMDITGAQRGITLYFNTSASTIGGYFSSDGSTVNTTFSSSGALPLNTWHHVAITWNGANYRTFVDGKMIDNTASVTKVFAQPYIFIGGAPSSIGYMSISNFRFVAGTALYLADFTPPIAPLTAIGGTQLLTCASNRLVDLSSNAAAITVTSIPAVQPMSPFSSSAYSALTNGGSMYFDGSGDFLTTPISQDFMMKSADFTIEFWVYPTAYNANNCILAFGAATGANGVRGIIIQTNNAANQMAVLLTSTNAGFDINSAYYGSFPVNQWNHLALTRSGSTFRIFQNGALLATITSAAAIIDPTATSMVYVGNDPSYNTYFTGYISSLNIVKGTAKYTAAFTAPTAPVTADANSKLLLNGTNAAITDSTGKVCVETLGSARADVVTKKYSGLQAFNGTTDALKISPSFLGNFGTNDFTVEGWFKLAITPAASMVLVSNRNVAADTCWSLYVSNASKLCVDSGLTSPFYPGVTAVSAGTWYHFAWTRQSGTQRLFLNGVLEGSTATAFTFSDTTPMWVGANPANNGWFNGQIEDVRVTRGIARYTNNFTIPLAAFPTV